MKENTKLLALLMAAFLLYNTNFLLERLKMWDETVYANLALQVSKNPFDYNFRGLWGDKNPTELWDKAGFRAPLLPYSLSIVYRIFGHSEIAESLFMSLISVVGILFFYLSAKKLFGNPAAFYSSALFSLTPLFADSAGRIFTEPLGLSMTAISLYFFISGYMEEKNKSKVFFAVFSALTALSRYPFGFIIFLPAVYGILTGGLGKIIKDKYFLYGLLAYIITISPWLAYSQLEYGSVSGFLIHSIRLADAWSLPADYVFDETLKEAGLTFLLGVIGLIAIRKEIFANKKYLPIISWLALAAIFTLIPSHKEPRYFLPLLPPLALLGGVFLQNKQKIIFAAFIILLLFSNFLLLSSKISVQYSERADCLWNIYQTIKQENESTLVLSDQSPVTFYYTGKRTHFSVGPDRLNDVIQGEKKVYIVNDLKFEPDFGFENVSGVSLVKECPDSGPKIKMLLYEPAR